MAITENAGSRDKKSCCFEAHLVAGAGGHPPTSPKILNAFRFLKWLPAKIALTGQFVEVRRVETGEKALFGFIGIGLGAGLSIAVEAKSWSDKVCCPNECPSLDDFVGFGRLTLVEGAVAVGGSLSFLDFGTVNNCRLYFENNLGVVIGIGAEIGTYLGYYVRLS